MQTLTNGQWLRLQRQVARVGLRPLAARIGLDYTWISRIENDLTDPPRQALQAWAEAVKCDADELHYRFGYMPPDLAAALANNPELRQDVRSLVKG